MGVRPQEQHHDQLGVLELARLVSLPAESARRNSSAFLPLVEEDTFVGANCLERNSVERLP